MTGHRGTGGCAVIWSAAIVAILALVGCRSTDTIAPAAPADEAVEAVTEPENTTPAAPGTAAEPEPKVEAVATPEPGAPAEAKAEAPAPTPPGPEPKPQAEATAKAEALPPEPKAEPVAEPQPEAPAATEVVPEPEPEPACAEEHARPGMVATYLKDRGADFMDMFGVRVGGGDTIYARLRLTKLGMLGAGFFRGKWFGSHGRAAGSWREKRYEGGISVLYEVRYERERFFGNKSLYDGRIFSTTSEQIDKNGRLQMEKMTFELADNDHHWADLGLGAGIMPIALDIHVSPLQFCDFALGLLCIDICDDDARHRPAAAAPEAEAPEPPAVAAPAPDAGNSTPAPE